MSRSQAFILAGTLTLLLALAATAQQGAKGDKGQENAKVEGYVLDSSCAYTKNLDKPISAACARSCAKAGSPLVILTADGTIYWPISGGIPATGQNQKLMPFAGERVRVSGKVYERGAQPVVEWVRDANGKPVKSLKPGAPIAGSRAIVIEKIERVASSKPAAPAH